MLRRTLVTTIYGRRDGKTQGEDGRGRGEARDAREAEEEEAARQEASVSARGRWRGRAGAVGGRTQQGARRALRLGGGVSVLAAGSVFWQRLRQPLLGPHVLGPIVTRLTSGRARRAAISVGAGLMVVLVGGQ